MPTLIKLLEIELSSTLTKRYSISGWPVTYDSNVYDNDGTFVGLGDLKFSLELENNPFEVTLHLSDQDVLDAINAYSYRFRDATLIIGEWDGTMIDQSTVIIKKGFIDTHSDPSADFTVDFTISSYLELASKQRNDVTASVSHSIKLKDGVFGDDNKTVTDTIFDKTGDDWNGITLGRTRATTFQTRIGGGKEDGIFDKFFGQDPIYQTTTIPAMDGVRVNNTAESFHTGVAYGRTKLEYQLVNAWNPTPAAVATAYPGVTFDEEDFDPLVFDETKFITMVFCVAHGPIEKLEVYNASNDNVVTLLQNGATSGTGNILRFINSSDVLAVIDVVNNGVDNVALSKSVTASSGAYTSDDRGIGYVIVHITAIASGFWANGIPELTFVADSTHIRALSESGVSPTLSGTNGSGEVIYDYINRKQYGLGLDEQYIDADSFYDFQANSLDIYPDKLRGSVTGSGSFIKFLERMQQSCACRIYEESGLVKLWYGDILDNSDIKKEFKDNGLSNTNCIVTQQNPRSRSVFNEVTARYYAIYDAAGEPPDNIRKTVIVTDNDYLVSDNGIKSTTSFDLDYLTLDADGDGFVSSADEQQINEIANLVLQKSRLFQEVEIVTSYDEASGLKLGDLIRCEVSRYGWEVADRRLFFIREIIYTADGNVSIIGQRHSNTVYGGVDSFTNIDVENTFPVRINGLNSLESYLTTGPQGPQGRFQLNIYIRAVSDPATPIGGSYVASTDTLTPPTNWFTTIGAVPDAVGDIYFSVAVYDPAIDPDTITPIWAIPAQVGTTGPRGSGDWHFRVGETLKGIYNDTELNEFLAMVVPGTQGDAPVQGDRLWIFASPSDDDQSITEQQVYIWVGNTWDNQAAAIDGNLLVSGTVTADNVVADISITAPVITGGNITGGTITGGVIEGASISAGVLRARVAAFTVNQNTPTSIFADLAEKRRAFTRESGNAPAIMSASANTFPVQNSAYTFSFPEDERLLNVNQDVPSSLTGYSANPDLLRRNWYTAVPYTFSAAYADEQLGSGDGEQYYGMVFPSCTVTIKSGNTDIASVTLPAVTAAQRGDSSFTTGGTTFGTGRFSRFGLSHGGTYTLDRYRQNVSHDSRAYRTDLAIYGYGFIRLQDDEHVEVTLGSAAASGQGIPFGTGNSTVDFRILAQSVGLITSTYVLTQFFFDINDSSQTDNADTPPADVVSVIGSSDMPVNTSIPQNAVLSNELTYDNVSNVLSINSLEAEKLEGTIDANVLKVTNLKPESIVAGTLSEVNVKSGDIRLNSDLTYGQFHTLNDIIDAYITQSEGVGFSLGNDNPLLPTFTIGDYDNADPPAWVATNDYVIGDRVTFDSMYYIPSEDISGDADNDDPETDTDRWDGIEIPSNSYLLYTTDTGLVIGGTITAGAVRGGTLLSAEVPTGTESGSFINLDDGTFLFGNSQEYFRYDGTNLIIAGVPVDGQLIETASITGDKLAINTVIARTIRSDNYVAPTLPENPPNQGYSLEHIEGIGFFEELRADLTGTVTAPSQTPSEGTFEYTTSAITYEYLDISVGDTLDDFFATDEDGVIRTYKGILSAPIYTLELPDNIESNKSIPASSNVSGASIIDPGAAYEVYTNLATNNITPSRSIITGGIWFGYDADDNRIGELNITNSSTGDPFVGSGILSPQAIGNLRSLNSSDPADTSDDIETFATGNSFSGGSVELGADIPAFAKLHMMAVYSRSTTSNIPTSIPPNVSEFDLTAGIRANSSITFEVKSNDGTSQTEAITQNQP